MNGHLQSGQLLTMWNESLFDPMANFFVSLELPTIRHTLYNACPIVDHEVSMVCNWINNPYNQEADQNCSIRYASVIWLFILIGHLNLIGVWFGEDQRTNIIRHMYKRDWSTHLNFNYNFTLINEHNWKDLCIQLKNQEKNTLPIIISKFKEVQFSIGFYQCFIIKLLMQHKFQTLYNR